MGSSPSRGIQPIFSEEYVKREKENKYQHTYKSSRDALGSKSHKISLQQIFNTAPYDPGHGSNRWYWHVSRRLQNMSVPILKLVSPYWNNLHCQRIHCFALRNVPFRLETKSLTDVLGCRSHKIMCTGKTFLVTLLYNWYLIQLQMMPGCESNQWYWHVSQFLTKLDCEQSLSVPQNQLSSWGNTNAKRRSRNWLYIIGEYNSKTSQLITCLLLTPDSLFLILNCIRHFNNLKCGHAAPQSNNLKCGHAAPQSV